MIIANHFKPIIYLTNCDQSRACVRLCIGFCHPHHFNIILTLIHEKTKKCQVEAILARAHPTNFDWSSSKTRCFVQSQSHCTNKLGIQINFFTNLHPKHVVVLCRVLFIQNVFQQSFTDLHPEMMFCAKAKPIVIRSLADELHFYQIFIQNMLFCVEWSSSKTWCDKFVLWSSSKTSCFV